MPRIVMLKIFQGTPMYSCYNGMSLQYLLNKKCCDYYCDAVN